MLKNLGILGLVALLMATPVKLFAGATEDARYIVTQTFTKRSVEGALRAIGPVLSSALENDLRKKGIEISDLATFQRLIADAFMSEYISKMQQQLEKYYTDNFTASELADIARFYRSDAGQAVIKKTPDMMKFGAIEGKRIGRNAAIHAAPNIKKSLKASGIVITKNKSMMQKLLDALK